MPYIKGEQRRRLDSEPVGVVLPLTKGELTYVVFKAAGNFLVNAGLQYHAISDAIAALRDAGDELWRRILVPWEKKKIQENGDIGVVATLIKALEETND